MIEKLINEILEEEEVLETLGKEILHVEEHFEKGE